MCLVPRWTWPIGFAFALMVGTPIAAQSPDSASRSALLERARQGFDSYMLSDGFEGARLARVQKAVFPATWNRMRDRFAEAAVDKLQGKISRDESQRQFQTIIRSSFADVEATILANGRPLGLAPHSALVAWERALNSHLAAHIASDPRGCSLANVLRQPASPEDVGDKLDLVAAFWTAYGTGMTSPVDRDFESLLPEHVIALKLALDESTATAADKRAILTSSDQPKAVGSLSCSARLSLSNAMLATSDEVQDRLIAHVITRPPK